jgi:hypothetical protein
LMEEREKLQLQKQEMEEKIEREKEESDELKDQNQ